MAVVPITRVQSRVASATESCSLAFARSGAAPTAETASRKAFSYGVTTRRWNAPKLLIARAAAPMFSGLRVRTNTIRKFSRLAGSSNRCTGAGPPGALGLELKQIRHGRKGRGTTRGTVPDNRPYLIMRNQSARQGGFRMKL